MRDVARKYLDAGLCVLPARRDQKRPTVAWKAFQKRLPISSEIDAWFANGHSALCVLTGEVSGRLELIDFDSAGELFEQWCDNVRAAAPGLLERMVLSRTQSDGRHAAYRHEGEVFGNLKLAQRKDDDGIVTLIETRGEGGLFLCAPTDGYELVQGDLCKLSVLTEAEREIVLQAAWALNEYIPPVVDAPVATTLARVANTDGQATTGPSDRPGDDFNARGDVRAILEQHGWVRTKGGQNEYWRRPGKPSGEKGWSATLKDNVFYVFSFEPNRPYSPFAVHALLACGGDYEQAARSLRQLGYGNDSSADAGAGADISAIVAQACNSPADGGDPLTEVADPGPFPEELFGVPGLVERVMDFTLANAPYPNLGLAFCGAIALQSYLAGRKVQTATDLRPNIYLLALASSGTGKDFPRKVNSRMLFEIGHIAALGDKFASGQGIQDALLRSNAMLFQNDEMDGVLRQINFDREGKQESIPNILLTLYTSADDIYPIRVKAGQKEMAHIDQPHLTLFGTATPQYFYEALSHRMLTNGLFARMIIVDIGKRGRGQLPGSVRNLAESILQTARWWAEFSPGKPVAGNLYGIHPEPRVVPFTPQAEQALQHLQRMAEDEWDRAHDANDEPSQTAWSRTCENATRLALIYACSESHEDPIIGLPAVEWATAFAMHQTRRQLHLASTYVAENPFHAECLKLLRKLKEAGDQMARRQLMRAMRSKAADFDQIISTLIQQGDIEQADIPTKTKPAQGYRLT